MSLHPRCIVILQICVCCQITFFFFCVFFFLGAEASEASSRLQDFHILKCSLLCIRTLTQRFVWMIRRDALFWRMFMRTVDSISILGWMRVCVSVLTFRRDKCVPYLKQVSVIQCVIVVSHLFTCYFHQSMILYRSPLCKKSIHIVPLRINITILLLSAKKTLFVAIRLKCLNTSFF